MPPGATAASTRLLPRPGGEGPSTHQAVCVHVVINAYCPHPGSGLLTQRQLPVSPGWGGLFLGEALRSGARSWGGQTGALGVRQGRTGCGLPAWALPAGVLGAAPPHRPPPGKWGLCGNIKGARRVHLLKPPTPTSQMGPCDSGSDRQEGKASRRGLCPARSPCAPQRHILDHAVLNHSVWPSGLATAAPVPRVAQASRKALKSCDQPPGEQCAWALAQPSSGGCGRNPTPPPSLAQDNGTACWPGWT